MTTQEQAHSVFEKQKLNQWRISQTSAAQRVAKLKKLKKSILKNSDQIKNALFLDFKKAPEETDLTEILITLEEINFAIKNIKKWMRPQKVKTPITLLGTQSSIVYEPKGHCLILAPWNYPFQLMISPLIGAIAAGNVVILKGSEKTPHTQAVTQKIIESVFTEDEVAVAIGDIQLADYLSNLPFDHIFFTGSTRVGKLIAEKASKNLTSVTLELGGKSPAIICKDADIDKAIERIVWAKFLNGGQTCVAPDFLCVDKTILPTVEKKILERVQSVFSHDPQKQIQQPHLARMIDSTACERMLTLIESSKNTEAQVLMGGLGLAEEKFVSPTIISRVHWDSTLMKEEIFGPILPIVSFENTEDLVKSLRKMPKPLALYVFTQSKETEKYFIQKTRSGGLVVNHLMVHLANPHLPFGGVGHSGLGAYHGFESFKAFSHGKSIMRASKWSTIDLLFPPYSEGIFQIAYKFFKWLVR